MFKVLALCKFKEINKNNHERIVIGTFMGEGRSKLRGLNDLLGPSIILEVLDLMLDSPEELFNIREIARRTGRSPGAISRTMPLLLKRGLVKKYRVGRMMVVYGLNKENVLVGKLVELKELIEKWNK